MLNIIINDNDNWEKKVNQDYNGTIGLPTIALENFLSTKSNDLSTFSFLSGGSLPTDILLLKNICKNIKNCSYFEIGTWRGESVKNVSEVARECYTLNLSKEEIIQLGKSSDYADSHGFFSKNTPNIKHLTGNSFNYNFKGLNKKFDVIFIDGDHHHDSIVSDTKNVFNNLMHEESIVVWHDYGFDSENIRYEVMHSILEGVPKELHQYLYHVQNTMCAIYTPKKYDSFTTKPYALPIHTFKINLEIEKLKKNTFETID